MNIFEIGVVRSFRSIVFMSDGGAAELLGGGGGDTQSGGGGADTMQGGGGSDTQAGGGGDDFVLPEWGKGLSAEAIDADTISDQAWLTNKKFGEIPDLVKGYRHLEKQLGAGDRIAIPKEGDPPEKFEAYFKAKGRPDSAEGYEISLPDGVELNEALFGSFREAAFQHGLSAAEAKGLGDWFVQQQLDADAAVVAQRNAEATAKLKEWGPSKDQNIALCQRAMEQLGLGKADVANIQMGFGAARTLDLLQKLGAGMAEDVLITGGSRQRFGITGSEAKAEVDKLMGDSDFQAKLYAGDAAAKARWERLNAAIAADQDAKDRANA